MRVGELIYCSLICVACGELKSESNISGRATIFHLGVFLFG
jgi:hypothetical protein